MMTIKSSVVIIIFAVFISAIACGGGDKLKNILFLNGMPSPSHHLWNRALIRGLAAKGYNITMVSVDDDKNPQPNIHYIYLEATYNSIYGDIDGASFDLLEFSEQSKIDAVFSTCDWFSAACKGILKSNGLDRIINYPNNFKFEAIIYDFSGGPCLLPLLHKFNYPTLVGVSAFNNPPNSIHLTGGQKYPALVPHYLFNFSNLMTYPQRLMNFFIYALDYLTLKFKMMPEMSRDVAKRFNYDDMPSITELEQMTKLVLVNSDDAIDFPEPLQPNMVQVGGLQIAEPKEIDENLKKFIESSKQGTILMSLGTNIKSNMLGDKRLTEIIKTFAELPQYNFVWKFESKVEDLPMKPTKNVFISPFLPQNDILAHQNVKAFVTHAGGLSTQEALWHGKPMIAVPFMVDQIRTAAKSEMFGVAVQLNYREWNKNDFKMKILEVLTNEKYKKNSDRISRNFQDKPMKPLDKAIWYIEHVMRNPESPQYQPTALKLGLFVANSYDVILTFFVMILTLTFVTLKVFKVIIGYFLVKKQHKTDKVKKEK